MKREEEIRQFVSGELKDSGERKIFETGAMRDTPEGKGRCDLMPLDVVGTLLHCDVLNSIEEFKVLKDTYYLKQALTIFSIKANVDPYTLMLEVSKHFEAGALKYSENNWKRGIPLHCYIDSGVRHLLKHLRGDKDEPHDRAFVWNMLCAAWTYENHSELDDIEIDLKSREEHPS